MVRRWLWLVLGFAFLGVGAVGVVLPGVPTTFPMILALACFSRSSRRLHDWLYHHRTFGPPLQRWSAHGVIPPRAKVLALTGMGASLIILIIADAPLPAIAGALLLMLAGAVYILRRPSHPPPNATL